MNRLFLTLSFAAIAIVGFCGQALADTIPYSYNPAVPIFNYHFPDSSSNLSTGTVTDLSTAGHNALPNNFTNWGLSTNVPIVGGNPLPGYSMDCGIYGDGKGLITNDLKLLTTQAVADYGGFVFDVWFYPTAYSTGSITNGILSYAGTETIRLGNSGYIQFNISNNITGAYLIQTSSAVTLNTWYHVVGIFDTKGNKVETGTMANGKPGTYVKGDLSLYVNDTLIGKITNTKKDSQGDDLNRPFGVGRYSHATTYDFSGLIYNPKVSFLIPEPSTLALLAGGLVGLLCYAWRKRR